MALVTVTVRQRHDGGLGPAQSFSSETQGISTDRVIYFTPSVCKIKNGSDGLVNSRIELAGAANTVDSQVTLWVTETVSAIAALDPHTS
jgi:hypothetical protein